jgi:hypothetical protein
VFFNTIEVKNNQTYGFAVLLSDQIWYITDSYAKKLQDGQGLGGNDICDDCKGVVWNINNTYMYKCCSNCGGPGLWSYVWYIKNGKAVKVDYTGGDLDYIGNCQFISNCSITDSSTIGGRTAKPYYLYWSNNCFKEYGGIKITLQQLLRVNGCKQIIDEIKRANYIIGDIYFRGNNIININLKCSNQNDNSVTDFCYVTLQYKNNSIAPFLTYDGTNNSTTANFSSHKLNDFLNGGNYSIALFPKIAVYPSKLPNQFN